MQCSRSGPSTEGGSASSAEQALEADEDDEDSRIAALTAEKCSLEKRLDFVEALVGPTEAQRRELQEQLLAARAAALRVRHRGAGIPVRWVGRLDEQWLRARDLSERDVGLLQGGHIPTADGVLQDVSLLGDPSFKPYDEKTGEPLWDSQGGGLQLTLAEVRDRFGAEVAGAVVKCAKELDQFDASRRIGVEMPWHPLEDRELSPGEVIDLLGAELSATQLRIETTRDSEPCQDVRLGTSSTHASTVAMSLVNGVFGRSDSPTPRSACQVMGGTAAVKDGSSSPDLNGATGRRGSRDDDPEGDYPWSLSDADVRDLLEKPQRSRLVPDGGEEEAASQKEIDEEVQRLLNAFEHDAPSFSSALGAD